jgi:hypothetical protein
MKYLSWFAQYPLWWNLSWAGVIVAGAVLEIIGAINKHLYTFSDMIDHNVPAWACAGIIGLLAYHFVVSR